MSNDIITVPSSRGELTLTDESVDRALARLQVQRRFVNEVMELGVHYGPMPGVRKQCSKCKRWARDEKPDEKKCPLGAKCEAGGENFLYKAGTELLGELHGVYIDFSFVERREEFGDPLDPKASAFFHYVVKSTLIDKIGGNVVGSGLGSCNSMESQFRWRYVGRECPACGELTIMKSNFEDAAWYCNARKGGCGAKFKAGTPEDVRFKDNTGPARVPNDDVASQFNNGMKKACTRSARAAMLAFTRTTGMFAEPGEDDDEDASRDAARRGREGEGKKGGDDQKGGKGATPTMITVKVGKATYTTAGIEAGTLVSVLKLRRDVDQVRGEGSAKAAMLQMFGVDSSLKLTDAQGKELVTLYHKLIAVEPTAEEQQSTQGQSAPPDDEVPFPEEP